MSKELKSYLSRKFEGRDSFLENIVFPIFGEEKFEDMYDVEALDNEDLRAMAQRTGIKSAIQYGLVQVGTTEINIYDVTVSDRVMMRRNRVGIQQLIRRIMLDYTSAFIIFHYEDSDSWDWRFSFCQKDNKEVTEAKRYTFLLGPGQSCRTAADNFQKLIDKHGDISRDDIVKAFDVEALSKEFFDKYKAQYEKFCNYIYDNCDDELLFGSEFAEWDEKLIRDYVKKLLGRIVFLHFLQKKGWLGVPVDKEWGYGDNQFMKHLFEASTQKQKDNYLDSVLEPLFANALNTKRSSDVFDLHVKGFRNTRIPYLNGGLFERDALDEPKSTFPASYFEELFDFFYQYNFTIDENDPNDAEVGIDPEMLGRIFENLLEDNKDKGAFYTPKEIVQYMCRESLIAYLTTCVMKKQGENHKPEEEIKESVRQLLNKPEDIVPRMTKEHRKNFDSYIRNVKICDPAIGSGAFPMGLLNELVRCRVFINAWAKDENGNLLVGDYAALKTEIISNNIYGVDIEKGAIDIARLRFWLSIIVDEQKPHVLPNFDYKFMQGNSLIPTFDGKYINLETQKVARELSIKLVAEKKELYKLKQLHYKASGNDKQLLDIKIKCSILRLIAMRLGAESRAWYDDHSKPVPMAFEGDPTPTSFDTIRKSLPEDMQKTIDLADCLYKQLNDKSVPVAIRSQIDIHFFDWRIMFTEVFDNGSDGFDIVIGNPPYVDAKKLKSLSSVLKLFKIYNGSADLFTYFIEIGINYCKHNGIVTMITSNKWMRSEYGRNLRNLVNKNTLIQLLDFGTNRLFNATVDTDIIIIRKDTSSCTPLIASMQDCNPKDNLYSYLLNNSVNVILTDDVWLIKKGDKDLIHERLNKVNTHLSDLNVNIYRGILTGCNDAFHITEEEKNLFINESPKNAQVISPLIRGVETEKYTFNRKGLWLINIHNGLKGKKLPVDIFDYPYIKNHLDKYYDRLVQRDDKGKTPYNLRNCAYLNELNLPKIIWQAVSKRVAFSYDQNGNLTCDVTTFFMTGKNLKYILAILNSKLFEYSLINIYLEGDTFKSKNKIIQNFPIPQRDDIYSDKIEILVDKVIEAKTMDRNSNTSSLEAEIDQLVYQLYGLTDEEIAIVEGKNE